MRQERLIRRFGDRRSVQSVRPDVIKTKKAKVRARVVLRDSTNHRPRRPPVQLVTQGPSLILEQAQERRLARHAPLENIPLLRMWHHAQLVTQGPSLEERVRELPLAQHALLESTVAVALPVHVLTVLSVSTQTHTHRVNAKIVLEEDFKMTLDRVLATIVLLDSTMVS